jgi:hypothetical protein
VWKSPKPNSGRNPGQYLVERLRQVGEIQLASEIWIGWTSTLSAAVADSGLTVHEDESLADLYRSLD